MSQYKTYEQWVYIVDQRRSTYGKVEVPQKVRVQAEGVYQAQQLLQAYGRVAGVAYEVDM